MWEAVDVNHARAVVTADGMQAVLIATFRDDGSLESFTTGEDGDLTTPYHGSGELAVRDDYRKVQGMMIPFGFSYARVSKGKTAPFWVGKVSDVRFE